MKKKESLIERHEEDLTRLAYLDSFHIRQLNDKEKAEKRTLAKRINKREKRMEKVVVLPSPPALLNDASEVEDAPEAGPDAVDAGPSSSMSVTTDANRPMDTDSEIRPNLNNNAHGSATDSETLSHAVLDLKNYRTHRADTFEKHAARLAKEEYEQARAEYLTRVPLHELTVEQKREKRTLNDRIRARERKRLKAAEAAGLASETINPPLLDIPQADIRLLILSAKRSKRKRDQENNEIESNLSERVQQHRAEQERLEHLTRLKWGKTEDEAAELIEEKRRRLTKDEEKERKTLRSRIKARNWYRSQTAEKLGIKLKKEINSQLTDTSQQELEEDRKTSPLSTPIQGSEGPGGLGTDNAVETEQTTKRKMGRPRKVHLEENTEMPLEKAITERARSLPGPEDSRRTNQFDANGVGITYFRLDLKRHLDAKTDEITKFIDAFNVEFEVELRALLKNSVHAVRNLLKESQYTPQLFAFAIRRRMELLDNLHLTKLLE